MYLSGSTLTIANGYGIRDWIISPAVTPEFDPPASVPTGNYRIRSFYNNHYLLTMSDDAKCYVTRQLQGNNIQRQTWSVTRNAETDLYTIQNAQTTRFLASGPGAESDDSPVIGQTTTSTLYPWAVQRFFISFLIGLVEPELSIGFSDYEVDDFHTVTLKPSDTVFQANCGFSKPPGPFAGLKFILLAS